MGSLLLVGVRVRVWMPWKIGVDSGFVGVGCYEHAAADVFII